MWQAARMMMKGHILRKVAWLAGRLAAKRHWWFSKSGLSIWMALACVAICAALYGWTLNFPMIFDDCYYLKENPFFVRTPAFAQLAEFRDFAALPLRGGIRI